MRHHRSRHRPDCPQHCIVCKVAFSDECTFFSTRLMPDAANASQCALPTPQSHSIISKGRRGNQQVRIIIYCKYRTCIQGCAVRRTRLHPSAPIRSRRWNLVPRHCALLPAWRGSVDRAQRNAKKLFALDAGCCCLHKTEVLATNGQRLFAVPCICLINECFVVVIKISVFLSRSLVFAQLIPAAFSSWLGIVQCK
jgi:hypothetical protein